MFSLTDRLLTCLAVTGNIIAAITGNRCIHVSLFSSLLVLLPDGSPAASRSLRLGVETHQGGVVWRYQHSNENYLKSALPKDTYTVALKDGGNEAVQSRR